jgi:hypothetical protein
MFAKLILPGFCRVVFSARQKLFLPGRFFPWKKPGFPRTGKNLPTLVTSQHIRILKLHGEREWEWEGMGIVAG